MNLNIGNAKLKKLMEASGEGIFGDARQAKGRITLKFDPGLLKIYLRVLRMIKMHSREIKFRVLNG